MVASPLDQYLMIHVPSCWPVMWWNKEHVVGQGTSWSFWPILQWWANSFESIFGGSRMDGQKWI